MTSKNQQPITFADRYQSVLVPVIFEPWARELIKRSEPEEGEHVLDLACGTGVVSREVAKLGLQLGSQTAVDYNPDMLGVARRLAIPAGYDTEWLEADAAALPFENDRFDLTYCQQALQFFPDRLAALRELRRVMKSGGRVAFCVQRGLEVNPLLQAQANALDRHVGPDAGAAVRAICGLSDSEEIRNLFHAAGFHDIEIEAVTLMVHHPDGRAFAEGAMGGMHTGDKLSGLTSKKVENAIADFLNGLGTHFDGTAMRVPHVSNVVTAVA